MKVLIVNASPRRESNTKLAMAEMLKVFESEGIEPVVVEIGQEDVHGCIACNACHRTGRCAFQDVVNETAPKFEEADGLLVMTPVYYASPNGTLVSFLDRLFYSTHFSKRMKVGAAFAAARRGGLESTMDMLNKYFTISQMPVASSCYWNGIYGMAPGEAAQDAEGLRVARTLAKNMSFLMKSIALGAKEYGLPENEPAAQMNFIR